jgi:hypothetical protein
MLTIFYRAGYWIIFATGYLIMSPSHASKEGMMVWSNFSIESIGVDSSGPVKVSGVQVDDRITSFRVAAFGREIALNPSQLNELREFPVNGMHISFVRGILKKQHYILLVTISKGFASGVEESKLIEIDNRGNVNITMTQRVTSSPMGR